MMLYDFQRVIKVETSPTLLDKAMPPGAVFDALDVSGSTRKAGQFMSVCNGMPVLNNPHLVLQPCLY